jgi:hypothetical protein
MALIELPFQGSPQHSDAVGQDSQTRIFRTTNLAADLPKAGLFASGASSNFPINWVISRVDYAFDGYDNGDVNTPVHLVTVTAIPIWQTVHGNGGVTNTYEDSERFDTAIDYDVTAVLASEDPSLRKTYMVPRLIYTLTKFVDNPISANPGTFTTDPIVPLLDRIGKINSADNDPFVGAVAEEWLCAGISSSRAAKRLWEYTVEYKHSGRFLDPADNTVKRRCWQDQFENITYESGIIGI